MLAGGKEDGRAIVACGRISSICAVVRSSTICMSWLVLSRTLLSFKVRLDYSTGSLAAVFGWYQQKILGTTCAGPRITSYKMAHDQIWSCAMKWARLGSNQRPTR